MEAIMTQAVTTPSAYRAAHERLQASNEPAWLLSLRKAAYERFQSLGFPDTHQEAWRNTNPAPIAETPFLPIDAASKALRPNDLAHLTFPGLEAHQLVFVDGRFAPELSRLRSLPLGVKAQSLRSALEKTSEVIEPRLGQYASIDTEAFVALNTSLFQDGAFIDVPKGVHVPIPIHVLFVTTDHGTPAATFPRVLVHLGASSQLTLIESYAGIGAIPRFTNAVTEVAVDEEARLDHYKVQREPETAYHLHTHVVEEARGANVTHHNLGLGGKIARTDLSQRFDGEGGELTLNGLYLLHGSQHLDNHTSIDHASPHCTSREFYKGILDGTSRGVFYGKVNVRKDAQKTNAAQTNKNLLLSNGALVDSIPALEINADDVKCAHGSSIGQLDKDNIFYLRSRGLDASTARSLLTYAFARDVITQIKLEPIRATMDELLLSRLPNGRAVKEALQ